MNTATPGPHSTGPTMNTTKKKVDTLLNTIKNETGVPGLSLALHIGSQKIMSSIGTISVDSDIPMTENTHFQLGCIAKLMTAMVTAELIEAGKLDSSDPIEKYIEELRGTDRGKELKIWHLLTHTGGYMPLNLVDPGVAYFYAWNKFTKYITNAPQYFKPGTVFSYEHADYVILGEIIERITGCGIFDLYDEMIFKPLKLAKGSIKNDQGGDRVYAVDHNFNEHTKKFEPLKPVPYGDFWRASSNAITLSIKDLLTIASTICGIVKSPSGMSEKAFKFVQRQVVTLPKTYGSIRHEQIPNTFGTGCAFYRNGILGINGSARSQTIGLRFDPQNNIAIVIGINVWKPYFRDSIIDHVLSIVRGESVQPFSDSPLESSLNDLSGTYLGPKGNDIEVICYGNHIICTLKSQYAQSAVLVMEKDENNILRARSETKHYSIGFFREPDTGVEGLMLGMSAFLKQAHQ